MIGQRGRHVTTQRAQFAPSEIAVVISHFEIGVVSAARPLARGTGSSPKLLLQTDRGRYILKRRNAVGDFERRLQFAHALRTHLRTAGFEVPAAIATRDTGEPALAHGDRVYEVFEFVEGDRYDGSLDETMEAGRSLASFHRAASGFQSSWFPQGEAYHDSTQVRACLQGAAAAIGGHESVADRAAELEDLCTALRDEYDAAARDVNTLGFAHWPRGAAHGDWHPGNMVFAHRRVAAVIDFDAVRIAPTVLDLANGMLQFSLVLRTGDPERWPDYFDVTRMRRFWIGYNDVQELDRTQRRVLLRLMVESLIAEAVLPIAATGSLGLLPGFGVLRVVSRKIEWLADHREEIETWLME